MERLKRHVDTIIILTSFATSMLWMNGKFNEIHVHLDIIANELEKIKLGLILY